MRKEGGVFLQFKRLVSCQLYRDGSYKSVRDVTIESVAAVFAVVTAVSLMPIYFGIATAPKIPKTIITITSSSNVKPFVLRMIISSFIINNKPTTCTAYKLLIEILPDLN